MIFVIIPCFNGGALLERCLRSLEDTCQSGGTQITLIDDASPIPVSEGFSFLGKNLRILRNPRNLGFVRTANRGAEEARGDILVFLNQDTEFISPGWDEELLRVFSRQPRTGIVGAKLVYPDSGLVQFAGGCLDGEEWKTDYLYYRAEPGLEVVNRPREVDWALGAFLAVRRDLFCGLGGFCTEYHSNYEDIDLCLRAKNLGYRTLYNPKIALYHHETATGLSDVHQGRSLSLFRRKWLGRLRRRQTDHYGRDGFDGNAVRRLMRLFGRDFHSVWRVLQDFGLHTPESQKEFAAGNSMRTLDRLVGRYAGGKAEGEFRHYRSRLLLETGEGKRLVPDLKWIAARGAPGLKRDESRLRLMLLGERAGRGCFHSARLGELAEYIRAVGNEREAIPGDEVRDASLRARYLEMAGELLPLMPEAERDRHAGFILGRLGDFPNRGALVAVLFRLAYLDWHGRARAILEEARGVIRGEEWDPVKRTQFAVNEASFLERRGDFRGALGILEEAGGERVVAPRSLRTSFLFHLGMNHARLGSRSGARRCLKGVLRLNPGHGGALKLLAEIGADGVRR